MTSESRYVLYGARAARIVLILAGAGAIYLAACGGSAPAVESAKIVANERGFEPDRITVRAGTRVRLTFVRTTDKTCATEVVFPSQKLTRELPLNEPTVIEFTPDKSGELAFACGMDMFKGAVVVIQ
jgi:plastocyanin